MSTYIPLPVVPKLNVVFDQPPAPPPPPAPIVPDPAAALQAQLETARGVVIERENQIRALQEQLAALDPAATAARIGELEALSARVPELTTRVSELEAALANVPNLQPQVNDLTAKIEVYEGQITRLAQQLHQSPLVALLQKTIDALREDFVVQNLPIATPAEHKEAAASAVVRTVSKDVRFGTELTFTRRLENEKFFFIGKMEKIGKVMQYTKGQIHYEGTISHFEDVLICTRLQGTKVFFIVPMRTQEVNRAEGIDIVTFYIEQPVVHPQQHKEEEKEGEIASMSGYYFMRAHGKVIAEDIGSYKIKMNKNAPV